MRNFASRAVLLALISLVACARVTAGVVGDDVNGADVQGVIDTKLAALLQSYDPHLKISPAQCAAHLDVSEGKTAYCYLPVNGVRLAVRVVYFGPPQQFKANLDGSFFETAQIESFVQKQLKTSYDIVAVAHCPGPEVKLLKPGAEFSCNLSGAKGVSSMHLKALPNGQLFFYNIPGLHPLDAPPADALTKHKAGQPVVLTGTEVAAYLQRAYVSIAANYPQDVSISCPQSVDLTGTKHAICLANLPKYGVSQRIGVWIEEPNGFRERPLDAVLDRGHLQDITQKYYNDKLAKNNLPADATVNCGTGLVAVPAPGSLTCNMTANGDSYRLIITIEDFKGTVHWEATKIASPSPAA